MANTPRNEVRAMMITRELTPDGERYTLSLCQLHAAVLTNAATLAGLAPVGSCFAPSATRSPMQRNTRGHHPDATQPPETVN